MRCSKCGLENERKSRFCVECGSPLHPCAQCGHPNPAGAKYCAECGATIEVRETLAERRQITVMFCDLVGSTALSSYLDPEELRDLIRDYQFQCAEAVKLFEGSVVQYLGDGVLAYFGFPHAHEDDSCRGGYAGLEIVRRMREMRTRWAQKLRDELAVRVGIHTGPVVVGEVGVGEHSEQLAIGETPNIAARLQSCAKPNTVITSRTTYRLISRFFECKDLGSMTLSGVAKPVHAFELVEKSEVASRREIISQEGLAPLVGRRREMAGLQDCWGAARSGKPQFVLLRGEAGIGKSALVAVLKERVTADHGVILEGGCSAYYQNSSFYALTQLLERWLSFAPTDAPPDRRHKIESAVGTLQLSEEAATWLLASLLAVPFNSADSDFTLSAAVQRERTLALLVDIPRVLAEKRPVLLLFEDLHWADPSSREYFNRCVNQYASSRLLIVMTSRPEFTPDWQGNTSVTLMDLGGLDNPRAEELVARTAAGDILPPDVVRQIVQRADGIPLFIEETTRAIIESGALKSDGGGPYELVGQFAATPVPMSLQDALMARLDRLGSARNTLQLGATIGRDFSYELLRAISHDEEPILQQHLKKGVSSGLLQQHGTPPRAIFVFKHSLMQDTAYQSLLRKTRQQHHQMIADVLENQFRETAELRPELLAYHHTAAGNTSHAITHWQKAGDLAISRAAFAEAISHLSEGLHLVEFLPQGPERDRHELGVQSSLGMALQAHLGYAAPEVDRAYAKARELCIRSGDSAELLSVLRGLHLFYNVRADYETGMQISRQMLDLAERDSNPGNLLEAHLALGLTSLYRGEFPASRDHLGAGIGLYEERGSSFPSFMYVGHSVAICQSYLARTLWFLGQIEEAERLSLASIELARSFALPVTIAQALCMHALLFHVRRDARTTFEWAQQSCDYSREHGFPYWLSLAELLKAWAIAEEGNLEEGLAEFRRGLESYLATGAKIGLSWFLAVLAQMLASSGQIAEGLNRLAEASVHVQATGERYYASEIERLKGELLMMRDPASHAEAEACFQHALAIARAQEAKSWELRAATSMARLWSMEGRFAAAHSLLQPVCEAFSEESNDTDVRDAQQMIDQLASA